jgi:hypothetical protein
MARDKAKDDTNFNCSQHHEKDYVSGLYGTNYQKVYDQLGKSCTDNSIKYSTHKEVYQHVKEKLGLEIPN